jgi:hypothetical protein
LFVDLDWVWFGHWRWPRRLKFSRIDRRIEYVPPRIYNLPNLVFFCSFVPCFLGSTSSSIGGSALHSNFTFFSNVIQASFCQPPAVEYCDQIWGIGGFLFFSKKLSRSLYTDRWATGARHLITRTYTLHQTAKGKKAPRTFNSTLGGLHR